jgi:hypothetical protein
MHSGCLSADAAPAVRRRRADCGAERLRAHVAQLFEALHGGALGAHLTLENLGLLRQIGEIRRKLLAWTSHGTLFQL